MYIKETLLLFFFLIVNGPESSLADPIDTFFPNAFEENSGINVHPKNMSGIEGYAIEEFPEEMKNRNHWDSREENPIQFLVMHYTACDFPSTLQLFTSNIPDGRVSLTMY